jgi:hypothetical protein
VDVRIDEPGHEDAVAMLDQPCIRRQRGEQLAGRSDRGDFPIGGDQEPVLEKLKAPRVIVRTGIGSEVENATPMRA